MDGARSAVVAEPGQSHRRDDVRDDRFSDRVVGHDHRRDELVVVVGGITIRSHRSKFFTDQSRSNRRCRASLYRPHVCC